MWALDVVKSINEFQQIKYTQDKIHYYDSVTEALKKFTERLASLVVIINNKSTTTQQTKTL